MKQLNNNIKESHVSFKVAKLLKEKGFDNKYVNIYTLDGKFLHVNINFEEMYSKFTMTGFKYYFAPEQWQVVEWIRVNFNFYITIEYLYSSKKYYWLISGTEKLFSTTSSENSSTLEDMNFNSPQEATEAALEYTLKNLV